MIGPLEATLTDDLEYKRLAKERSLQWKRGCEAWREMGRLAHREGRPISDKPTGPGYGIAGDLWALGWKQAAGLLPRFD